MIAFVNEDCFDEIMKEELVSSKINMVYNTEEQDTDSYTIFNLSSALNFGDRLTALVPINQIGSVGAGVDYDDEKTFDMAYASYLLNDRQAFTQVFKIIFNMYNGGSSVVLIGEGRYKDIITESLIKFIQQRYGFSPIWVVNSIDDWRSYDDDGNFNLVGVYNLDIDKERFIKTTVNIDELEELIRKG